MSDLHRHHFFDFFIKTEACKNALSGRNENQVIQVLESLGFKKDLDFHRQHPIGNKFVLDIAFIKEQVAIEVDGDNHLNKKQIKLDKKRDRFLIENNWVPIRITDKDFFGYKALFYKYLIREVVELRRSQYELGNLHKIEFPDFKDY